MKNNTLRIGLASLRRPASLADGLAKVDQALQFAAGEGARIVCFPESYIPGLRGCGWELPEPSCTDQEIVLTGVSAAARRHGVAAIIGLERSTKAGLLNLAYVINAQGRVLGYQTKNQIVPRSEEAHYVPDGKRRLFTLAGVRFGVVICHEGWRYPETVRWAAVRGAQIVFQPQCTGADTGRRTPQRWGEHFFEKAMVCRAGENTIYFASVNNAMRAQSAATSLIAPNGACLAHVPYGREQVLIYEIDLKLATRRFAKRYNPCWYPR